MKRANLKEELRRLSINELKARLDEFCRELFGLRLNTSTAHVKDYSQFKKLRSNVALVKTLLQEAVS